MARPGRPHPAWATAYVAAAHRFQLWVNGTQRSAGPSFCFPDEQYVQATDVTAAISAGAENAVGVLHHWYGPGRGRPTSSPGLLVQVVAHFTDGRTAVLSAPAPGGGRAAPNGWPHRSATTTAVTSSNGSTPAAIPTGGPGPDSTTGTGRRPPSSGRWARSPFTHLYAQRTRITEARLAPASLRTLPTGSVVADFGRVYAGRPDGGVR